MNKVVQWLNAIINEDGHRMSTGSLRTIAMIKAEFARQQNLQQCIVNGNTVLPAMRLSMEEILKDAVKRQATYQVQFADYDLDTWTAPCQLTEDRIEKLLNDWTIRKVRLELEM